MAWSTIQVGLTTTTNTTENTSPVSLTYTLPTANYQDALTFVQSVYKNGGILIQNRFFPVTSIQYLDIS